MRLGIFAKTFEGSEPGMVLDAAAIAGFTAVQYNIACSGLPSMPDSMPAGAVAAIRSAAQAAKVEIVALYFLSRLKAVGFEGPLVTHGLAASEAPEVARFLRRTLDEAGIKVCS
jgi:sugar phosphate isomerase/epimerase